jgi:23S rRNA pseudouridine1911/1915/1917 synthase
MASTGHPLLGDTLYHSDDKISFCASFSRAALHAWKVSFQHPFRDEMLLLEAPLSFDFRELVSLSGSDLLSI